MSGVRKSLIEAAQDEHVFVRIETPERPTISIDVGDGHGRRYLTVRLDGMTVASLLADVEHMPPMEERGNVRFCPYCGEGIEFVSSRPHTCEAQTAGQAKEAAS